jgi:GTP-binding protein HflX
VLLEVVDVADTHAREHRATVQQVLNDLGAGDKPRLLVYNKADLVDPTATNAALPAPTIAGSVLVSAMTGYGMDTLRTRLAALLADLWEEVDVNLPYSEGELLSRVRERGTVDIGYRARDVRVRGRVTPTLASELRAAAFGRTT